MPRRATGPEFAGDAAHLEVLTESLRRKSPLFWNRWREQHPRVIPDLRRVNLAGRALRGLNLTGARLDGAILVRADLGGVAMERASLRGANLWFANLSFVHAAGADLTEAQLRDATLRQGDFRGATCLERTLFEYASLRDADFTKAKMKNADFAHADLTRTRFDGADLSGASFERAILDETSFLGATIRNAYVGGALIRRVRTDEKTDQRSLMVDAHVVWERPRGKVIDFVEVDDIRLAQFHDTVDEYGSIASLMSAASKRVVLILGRFLPRRKRVLKRLADALRVRGKIPVIFDFPGPKNREISDTVRFIAGMSQFIVVDMTNASSVPMELQASIPELMVPVLPIVEAGKDVFSMFADLQRRYFWILQPVSYKNADELVQFIDEAIIGRAEKAAEAINTRRTESVLPPVRITGVMRKKR